MKKMQRSAFYAIGLAMFLMGQTSVAQFEKLTKWIPDNSNTLVLVRVDQIFNSQLAKDQNWKQQHGTANQSGIDFLPMSTKRFVVATEMDFEYMEPLWTASVYEKSGGELDITKFCNKLTGKIESVNGFDAMVLNNDVHLVKVAGNLAASIAPANHQNTSRWLQSRSLGAPNLSSYLQDAVNYADKNADVIVAMDLKDVLGKDEIRARLEQFSSVDKADLDAATDILTMLQGITLGITFTDRITAAIKIDFASDPSRLDGKAKSLLLEALGANGLMIDDFEHFDINQDGNHFKLAGTLSPEGMRNIGVLINHPVKDAIGFGNSELTEELSVGTNSKRYFDEIESLIEEFRGKPEVKNLNIYATWFERYARKIDQISVISVDEELIKYSQFVSNRFREISGLLRSTELTKTRQTTNLQNWSYSSRYGGYGGYSNYYYDNTRNRLIASSVVRQQGVNSAREIINEISQESARVRKEMSVKYNVPF